MAFYTKTYEAYGNIRVKPNQPCNYLNRGHKSKVNIFGQYILVISRFGFEGWIWVLIASVPDLCIFFLSQE